MTEQMGNFFREMVDAAKALEREPELLAQVERAAEQHKADGERVARLELLLIEKANEISALTKELGEVKSERDDAGFRFVETQKQLDAIREAVGVQDIVAAAVAKATVGLVPAPQPEPVGQSEASPTPDPVGTTTGTTTEPDVTSGTDRPREHWERDRQDDGRFLPMDRPTSVTLERVAGPEVPAQPDPTPAPVISTPQPSVANDTSPEPVPSQPSPGLYTGKRYYDIPTWISRPDWLAGGGTEEDYDWRPGRAIA